MFDDDFWYESSAGDDGATPPRPTRTRSWGAPDTLTYAWEV